MTLREREQRPASPFAQGLGRLADLDRRLGDPDEPANPVGWAALLEADEAGEVSFAGERALDGFGLAAEMTPVGWGGRYERLDVLTVMLRQVFRRDASLGVGLGLMTFMAAVPVWAVGSEKQQRQVTDLLLGGGRMTNAYHEVAHSNDLLRDEYTARPTPGGFLVDGQKQVVFNGSRADVLTLFCRTGSGPGPFGHSVLLVDRASLPADRFRELPRHRMLGLRSCHVAGLAFDGCPVDGSALVGEAGAGAELALRSFQLARTVAASAAVGVADTALRICAVQAGRSSGPAAAVLAGAFADLLLCDALVLAATRAAHLLPEETGLYSALAKYLVPRLLQETLQDLSSVLGRAVYERHGATGYFQKCQRDLPVVGLGHAGTAACQATALPQLLRLASGPGFRGEEAPAGLFRPGGDLPPLPARASSLVALRDPIGSALTGRGEDPAVAGRARLLVDELDTLSGQFRELAQTEQQALGDPKAFALTDRYALLLAASAVLNVWRAAGPEDAFLSDPAWAATALDRLCGRLGLPSPDLPAVYRERLLRELHDRCDQRRGLDLYALPTVR
jgi:alkylation response protein AidB-like acyl-CoA dehydrogenase